MIALQVVPENFNEILNHPRTNEHLKRSYLEDAALRAAENNTKLFFIPDVINRFTGKNNGWLNVTAEFLEESGYKYELPRTPDRWFEITPT